jgi:hypothetical protein
MELEAVALAGPAPAALPAPGLPMQAVCGSISSKGPEAITPSQSFVVCSAALLNSNYTTLGIVSILGSWCHP